MMDPRDFWYVVFIAGLPLFVILILHFLITVDLLPSWAYVQ